MRKSIIGMTLFLAASPFAMAIGAGQTGAKVSGLEVIQGKPDFSKAKLTLAEFWAIW
jgi:hypothetical protein